MRKYYESIILKPSLPRIPRPNIIRSSVFFALVQVFLGDKNIKRVESVNILGKMLSHNNYSDEMRILLTVKNTVGAEFVDNSRLALDAARRCAVVANVVGKNVTGAKLIREIEWSTWEEET